MKRFRAPVFLLGLFFSVVAAHATTITYNLSNAGTTFSEGNSLHGTLTGSIAVDSATSLVTGAQLMFDDPSQGNPVFSTIASAAAYNGLSQAYITAPRSSQSNYGGQIALFFDTTSVGRGSLSICTATSTCGTAGTQSSVVQLYSDHGNLSYNLTGGNLASAQPRSVALTPEPSSLLLLGTGILGAAGFMLFYPAEMSARRNSAQLKTSA